MLAAYWRWVVFGFATLAALTIYAWQGPTPQAPATKPAPLEMLPALQADLTQTTVSGISAGAYMAGQFQIAHASLVTGAGIIAGGPYGCAQSVFSGAAPGPGAAILSASRAINGCMQNALTIWGVPNPARLAKKARKLAEQGQIDAIADVATDRIYLFSGLRDKTVKPPIVMAAQEFYKDLGVPPENILFKNDMEAGHGFVTTDKGSACTSSGQPFIIDCDYDQAGALLNHLYPNLSPPADNLGGEFVPFDQLELSQTPRSHGLSKTGVAYIPKSCRTTGGCRVHIAFHGCLQNRASVGSAFIKQSGFARWADPNQIIVLFPQVAASALNPTGCWDWWGYTGKDYLTKSAPQVQIVRAMLDRLATTPAEPQPGT